MFLDPLPRDVHRLSAPTMLRALKEHEALAKELVERSAALERAGYHAQVKVAENSTLGFRIVDGQRVAVRPKHAGLAARNIPQPLVQTLKATEQRYVLFD